MLLNLPSIFIKASGQALLSLKITMLHKVKNSGKISAYHDILYNDKHGVIIYWSIYD